MTEKTEQRTEYVECGNAHAVDFILDNKIMGCYVYGCLLCGMRYNVYYNGNESEVYYVERREY